jgi:hypothetical protein
MMDEMRLIIAVSRDNSFRDGKDLKCVVSGRPNLGAPWSRFQAAHM